jgi:hypothetical protein
LDTTNSVLTSASPATVINKMVMRLI